jgi:hypothetical protein
MKPGRRISGMALAVWLAIGGGTGLAHITPPVVLISDQDAVLGMTSGAKKFFVREVRLTPEERDAVQRQSGWRPEGDLYRAYLGRDDAEQLVAAVMFLTEYTIHGPVRVAVGVGADGKIKGARVVELTEETYPWLKPLIDQDFTRDYVGRDSRSNFGLSERLTRMQLDSMPAFYAQVVASLIQRAAVLFDVVVLKHDRKI